MKKAFLLLSWILTCSVQAQQLAFPGAEGYGAYASGGRGCTVVHVTNLNAAGAGSLANAVSQPNRFVVFDVGGVIDITGKSITIASNITIAGQTAPGEGITIYGGRVIASKAKNVIMRYIRMRGGKSVNSSKCTLTLDECENFIMDHCSVSWGPWDNVHIKDANNITWQYCINSEGIEPQRFGSITDGTRNWTVHHCLWADNKSRNPKMKCYMQYYNNVVYNYGMGIIGGHSAADNYQDVMNNYFIAGPNGSAKYFDDWTATDHLYSSGNYFDGNCDGVLNGTLIADHNSATAMSKPNFNTTHPMNVETAKQACKEHFLYGRQIPEDQLFYEYAENWYRLKKEPFISSASRSSYKSMFVKHLLPVFGLQHLTAIDANQLQAFLNEFAGASKSTITLCVGIRILE